MFLYQRTLQGLSMLWRLFVVHIQNHRRHGKSICKNLCHGNYGGHEIQIVPSDKINQGYVRLQQQTRIPGIR